MHHPRIDPSPTALRSPLSPRERAAILIFIPLQGERGDRKAVGEGSLSTQSTLTGPCATGYGIALNPNLRRHGPQEFRRAR